MILSFIKKYKAAIIAAVLIAAVLTVAFISGGKIGEDKSPDATFDSAASDQATVETTALGTTIQPTSIASTTVANTTTPPQANQNSKSKNTPHSVAPTEKPEANEQQNKTATQSATDKYKTDPIPQGKPKPVEPQEQTTGDNKIYCTFSISCATILNNKDKLDPDIADIVPSDGWILKPQKIEITGGESVFDVLTRVCKDKKIHMEYSWTPIYNSAYIEGIANIYEFDCGDLSGWMYKVNDWYPNYGCSRYVLKSGDTVEWNYTCSSGRDLGKEYN